MTSSKENLYGDAYVHVVEFTLLDVGGDADDVVVRFFRSDLGDDVGLVETRHHQPVVDDEGVDGSAAADLRPRISAL